MDCIFTHAELIDGHQIVRPENFNKLIESGMIDKDLERKIIGEQFEYDLKPVLIIKKGTYTQAHKKAQQKYREKNRAEYNEQQRKLYEKKKEDAEWKKKFNERSKENNKIYRQKIREAKMNNPNYEPKKRGRPRKDVNITPQL
jgi:hydroxymethylpyrimidine pyrophosphatase-like HAD family hydrolase